MAPQAPPQQTHPRTEYCGKCGYSCTFGETHGGYFQGTSLHMSCYRDVHPVPRGVSIKHILAYCTRGLTNTSHKTGGISVMVLYMQFGKRKSIQTSDILDFRSTEAEYVISQTEEGGIC